MNAKPCDTHETILVVDDEQNILRSLKRELLDMPYVLLTASSAAMALEMLQSQKVSVIISDQRMPAMCGTELLSIVREKYPDTVRILLTAFSDMQDTIDAINKGGIYKYLQKPWDTHELKQTIADAVDHYRLARQQSSQKQNLQGANMASGPEAAADRTEAYVRGELAAW